jgi:hypothetical protein
MSFEETTQNAGRIAPGIFEPPREKIGGAADAARKAEEEPDELVFFRQESWVPEWSVSEQFVD